MRGLDSVYLAAAERVWRHGPDHFQDVLLNKVAIVERCLARIREEYVGREDELDTNQTRQDSIVMLEETGCIAIDLSERMQAMVGFRNIAVHNYQMLQADIVRAIPGNRLDDFTRFTRAHARRWRGFSAMSLAGGV